MKRLLLTLILLLELVSACPAMCAGNSCAPFVDCDIGRRHDYDGVWNFMCKQVVETGNFCSSDDKCVSCDKDSLCVQACPDDRPVWSGSACVARDDDKVYKICESDGDCESCDVGTCWGCPASKPYWDGSDCVKKYITYSSMKINGEEATSIVAAPGTSVVIEFADLSEYSQPSTTCLGIIKSWGSTVDPPVISGLMGFCLSGGSYSTHTAKKASYTFTMPASSGEYKVGMILYNTDASSDYAYVDSKNDCTLASILGDSNWDDGISCFDASVLVSASAQQCSTDAECTAGSYCDVPNHNCLSCTVGDECVTCPTATPYWTGSVCGECTTAHLDKCNNGKKCSSGTCVACSVGESCATCLANVSVNLPYWNGTDCKPCYEDHVEKCGLNESGKKCSNFDCVSCEWGENCSTCYQLNSLKPYWNNSGCASCMRVLDDDVYVNRNLFLCDETFDVNDTNNNGVLIFNASASVDCNGATFSGDGTGYLSFIDGKDDSELKNCEIVNYKTGVFVNNASGVRATNNFMHDLNSIGIWYNSTRYGLIIGNNLTKINATVDLGAILINTSNQTNITGNYIYNCTDGETMGITALRSLNVLIDQNVVNNMSLNGACAVDLSWTNNSIFEYNNLSGTSGDSGLLYNFFGSNNIIRYNEIKDGSYQGIVYQQRSNNVTSYGNYVHHNKGGGPYGASGIVYSTIDMTLIQQNNTFAVDLLEPADENTTGSDVTFKFNATNIMNYTQGQSSQTDCDVYIDGVKNTTISAVTDNAETSTLVTGIAYGTHNWYVYCYDNPFHNNTGGNTTTWNFTVSGGKKMGAPPMPSPTPTATPTITPTPTPEPTIKEEPPIVGVETNEENRYTMHAVAAAIEPEPTTKTIAKEETIVQNGEIRKRIISDEKVEARLTNIVSVGYNKKPDVIKKEGDTIVLIWNNGGEIEYWYKEAKPEKGILDLVVEWITSLVS